MEADFNYQDFTASGMAEADKALLVKFFIKTVQDQTKTLEEGRPIYRDKEYIDIKIAGDRTGGANRPATIDDKERFPLHYKAFKDRVSDDDILEGTPLAEWTLIPRSLAEELSFHHVKTVEQLATMADGQVSNFMGLYAIKDKAKLWLENAAKEKPLWEMDQKLKKMSAENQDLSEMVKGLMIKLEKMGEPVKKKGRPKKVVED